MMKKNIFKNKKKCTLKKVISYLIFLFPLIFLYGCHTMEGAGTDIQHAGKALERSADEHKPHSRPCPCCCH